MIRRADKHVKTAKGCPGPPRTGRARKDPPLELSERAWPCWYLALGPLATRTMKECLLFYATQLLILCYSSPRKWMQWPNMAQKHCTLYLHGGDLQCPSYSKGPEKSCREEHVPFSWMHSSAKAFILTYALTSYVIPFGKCWTQKPVRSSPDWESCGFWNWKPGHEISRNLYA